jgi:hypothetical protein
VSTHRDDERDAHLRAALRHAPDRETAAPAKLSEQILGAARRSVQPPSAVAPWPRRVRDRLVSALDALTRPVGATALASLVLATVIGVMWHEGDPTNALPEHAPGPDTATAARSSAAAASAARAEQSDSLAALAVEQTPGRAADASVASKPAPESKRRGASSSSADLRRAQRSQAAPASETTATADASRPDAIARSETRQRAAESSAAAGVAAPRSEVSAMAQSPAAPATPPPTPAAPSALRSSPSATAPDPLASVVHALGQAATDAPSATTHRWQRGDAEKLPHGPAAQAWLAELRRATQGLWQPRQGPTTAGANALLLSNEAGVVARVELTDTGVTWHHTSTPHLSWSAPLPEATLVRLREQLAAWAGR